METKRWSEIKHGKRSLEQVKKIEQEAQEIAMTLRQLREACGKTQVELAEATAIAQGELSKFERRDDHHISTLRTYVEALGGHLEIVAVVNGKRITLEV